MSDYDELLAPIDRKLGRPVTMDDWRALGTKSIEDFTDDDLDIVRAFESPTSWRAKKEARDRWLTPAQPSTPVVTASAPETTAPDVTVADDNLTWDQFVEKHGEKRMTLSATAALFKLAAESNHRAWHDMNERNKERNAKIAALEQRVAALEEKPHVKFCGTWERGKTYEPGAAVVRDGGLWICKATTPGEPSKDFVGWQLAVRKGSV